MQCDTETKNRKLASDNIITKTSLDAFYFYLPGHENIELVQDGSNIVVTLDNVQEYIDLVLHSTFYECVNLHA